MNAIVLREHSLNRNGHKFYLNIEQNFRFKKFASSITKHTKLQTQATNCGIFMAEKG